MSKEALIKLVKRMIRVVLGLLIFSFGNYLKIVANIGLAPWDCLAMGLSGKTGLSYGTWMTIVAVVILVVDLLLKESIGIGTVIDALVVGPFIDTYMKLIDLPYTRHWYIGVPVMFIGFMIMALGMYFYMGAGLSCGPRDAFLVAIGKRLRKLKIGVVEIIIMVTVALVGFALGGKIGIGTLEGMFLMGLALQIVFGFLKFEPRNIEHENILKSIKNLKAHTDTPSR